MPGFYFAFGGNCHDIAIFCLYTGRSLYDSRHHASGAQAGEPALAMAPVAALTFTVPVPNVPPRMPKAVLNSMPRSMPVKHRAGSTSQPKTTTAQAKVHYRPYMKDPEKRIRAA